MKRVIPFLVAKGLSVTDLTQQSWHLNKRNTDNLKHMLEGVRMHAGSFLIADLFGNTSVKYRQEDDTLALTVKTGGGSEGGGWHMMGDVVASPDEALVGQVRGLVQVLDFLKDIKKVFIPPIPRFVFGGCCASKHHAPNTSEPNHLVKMITEHIRQRHTITKALVNSKATHFRVTDVLSICAATHESLIKKNTQVTHLHAQRQCPSDAGWLQVAGRRDLPGLQHHLVQAAEYSQAAQNHNSSAK